MADRAEDVVLRVFQAVEQRDAQAFADVAHPEIELHWPASLPYGGVFRATDLGSQAGPSWEATWTPLQPTKRERCMDPRVVAAAGDEVVVLWHQRGVDRAGDRFDGEVLGLYRVRDGRLVRAQMFYFDPVAALDFLDRAFRAG
ncbi:MAG: nuclear transport factor 2 family protein [bacterium]|jgi:ketosteroid isomerase-like protein|nr:nuclear transport factor 2 family protein [bacterium]